MPCVLGDGDGSPSVTSHSELRTAAAPRPTAPRHRLVRWQRLVVYGSGGGLLLTGAVWLALHYSVGAGADQLPHPLEIWCLRLHAVAAFAALFGLGALAATHIPQGWRMSERQRWAHQQQSGVLLCGLAALLVLTGYTLYYFAPEGIRAPLGWLHAAIGLVTGGLVLSHRRGA